MNGKIKTGLGAVGSYSGFLVKYNDIPIVYRKESLSFKNSRSKIWEVLSISGTKYFISPNILELRTVTVSVSLVKVV